MGKNLLLTPGIYHLNRTIEVKRPDTVVLGLGFPTLVPQNGTAAMTVAGVPGVKLVRHDLRRRPGELAGPAAGRRPARWRPGSRQR